MSQLNFLSLINETGIKETINLDDIPTYSINEQIEIINRIKIKLHEISPFKNEPVDCVLWIESGKVISNDYNPNKVAPPEMELLKHSIDADGFTQPIVSWPQNGNYEVIDGFHRSRIGKECESINSRLKNYLPLTIIKPNRSEKDNRIASTIRHNRARGKHQIDAMSDIVIELKRRNWSNEKVGKELGMDADEVLRLTQITGLTEMFTDQEFSNAWDIGAINDEIHESELLIDENIFIEQSDNTDRIYHTWEKWECYKSGFFETKPPNKMTDDEAKHCYKQLLSDISLFESVLQKVITEWPNSCEHNLTNTSLNRIAWLGQASLAYHSQIPAHYRTGYHLLTEQQKNDADNSALKYLNKWLENHNMEIVEIENAKSQLMVELY